MCKNVSIYLYCVLKVCKKTNNPLNIYPNNTLHNNVCVVGVKISLLLVKNVFINVREGMSELGRWVAAKHTTFKLLPLAFCVLKITEILK